MDLLYDNKTLIDAINPRPHGLQSDALTNWATKDNMKERDLLLHKYRGVNTETLSLHKLWLKHGIRFINTYNPNPEPPKAD